MSKRKKIRISSKKQQELSITGRVLVGNKIKIIESYNKNQIGMNGLIIFESSNLFYVNIGDKIKKILKNGLVFDLEVDKNKYRINSTILIGNLTNRLKKIK